MDFKEMYYDFGLEELEQDIKGIAFQTPFSFEDILKAVYEDKGSGVIKIMAESIREMLLLEWNNIKNIVITLVIIIMISALFHTFKDVFQNYQIAELSFYVNYLVLMLLVAGIFGQAMEIGEETLRDIEEFMRIFFPTYFCLIGTTTGPGTGLAYYQIAGLVIYFIEWGFVCLILPALSTYMLFILMNGVWEDGKLGGILKLFQQGIRFVLKLSLGVLTGAGILQSFLSPLADRIKGETFYKAVEIIPGIGEVTEGTLRIWLGSAVLIKNSVGIAGCVFLIFVCLSPILKICILGNVLKITSAILGVVGEKKMIACVNQVGDAIFLILRTVSYGFLFFLVLIALTAYSTNGGF